MNRSKPAVDLNDKATVSAIMREMGRRGRIKGAATLNSSLTAEERKLSAQRASKARWAKRGNTDHAVPMPHT